MSTETTRGHAYDGIDEFDNRLPNWWLWSFYLACIFSVFYWIHYHTLGTGDLPGEAFVLEQQQAQQRAEEEAARNPVTDESLTKLAQDPAVVAEGEKIFKDPARCALCHKPDGSGNIGPNLTDDMWIYGGKPMDVYTTVLKGRPGGMLPYEAFGRTFVQRSVAYVLSIKGRNLPGKAPEPNAKKEQ
ncbi:MAG: c-type cytochrome [Planctomycetes bacterium]|nr:c-type cytochrome [Planctomycetota bacterium]